MNIDEILEKYKKELKENDLEKIYIDLDDVSGNILTDFLINKCGISDIGKYFKDQIPDNCFYMNRSIKNINIPGTVKVIGEYAFADCENLESIALPIGLTTIDTGAFKGCVHLKDINIPDSVVNINHQVFYYCTRLESIRLSNNLQYVSESLFSECVSLKNIVIPNKVKDISHQAFYNCSNLSNITIPSSVMHIGGQLFEFCTSLTSINYKGTKKQWDQILKDPFWEYRSSVKSIICTDGSINSF